MPPVSPRCSALPHGLSRRSSYSASTTNIDICSFGTSVLRKFGRWPLKEVLASSLIRCPSFYSDQVASFNQEIEKHMFVKLSALELHLTTSGHVYGAFVFHLIGMNQICTAMRRLKVILREAKVIMLCF
jgi:hypothetical protein